MHLWTSPDQARPVCQNFGLVWSRSKDFSHWSVAGRVESLDNQQHRAQKTW
jgi:hypothetical protein